MCLLRGSWKRRRITNNQIDKAIDNGLQSNCQEFYSNDKEEIDNAKIAESKNGRDLIEITIMKAASWGK